MTRAFAINGSPRKRGNTAFVLENFLHGLKEAGASVALYNVAEIEIKPCQGDFHCWYERPGECIIKDGMRVIYPKLWESDLLILATPVYSPLSGEMQNFLNRLMPLLEPVLEFRNGRTRACLHSDVAIDKILLVATSGWWELGNFSHLIPIFENLALDASVEFPDPILRPHASLLKRDDAKAKEVIEALKAAGKELVLNGSIQKDLLDKISQPLVSEEEFRRELNEDYARIKSRREGSH